MKNGRIRFRQQKWKTKLQTEQKCRIKSAQKQDCSTYRAVIKLVKRHQEPHVLLYFSGFPG